MVSDSNIMHKLPLKLSFRNLKKKVRKGYPKYEQPGKKKVVHLFTTPLARKAKKVLMVKKSTVLSIKRNNRKLQ